MSQEHSVEKLLEELQSEDASRRREAAETIGEQKLFDDRLVEAMKSAALQDANFVVRNAARSALQQLGVELPGEETPPQPAPDPEAKKKRRDFWLGVGLFFGWNIALWGLGLLLLGVLSNSNLPYDVVNNISTFVSSLPYVLNIGLIILLAFKRPQMALGMLAGFGIAIAIVVCLGLLFMAACFGYWGSGG